VGLGHSFDALGKFFLGNEVTVAYTYENGGPNGFWHSSPGTSTSTESAGLMKNFSLGKLKKVTFYAWPQIGITSILSPGDVTNRLYSSMTGGGIIHLTKHTSIWVQESYNKIVDVPWYTSTSIGYTVSF
jgi:hypothetical protein